MTTAKIPTAADVEPRTEEELRAEAAAMLPPELGKPVEGPPPGGEQPAPKGLMERITGPYASKQQRQGTVVAGVVGGLAANRFLKASHPSAGLVEGVTAALVGAELGSGAWAGSGPAARRWFAARGTDASALMQFTAVHVQPMAVALFAPRGQKGRALLKGTALYAATLGATALVAGRTDDRTVWAWGATGALSAASLTVLRPPRGWEWLGPAYATRLVVGHAAG